MTDDRVARRRRVRDPPHKASQLAARSQRRGNASAASQSAAPHAARAALDESTNTAACAATPASEPPLPRAGYRRDERPIPGLEPHVHDQPIVLRIQPPLALDERLDQRLGDRGLRDACQILRNRHPSTSTISSRSGSTSRVRRISSPPCGCGRSAQSCRPRNSGGTARVGLCPTPGIKPGSVHGVRLAQCQATPAIPVARRRGIERRRRHSCTRTTCQGEIAASRSWGWKPPAAMPTQRGASNGA